MMRLASLVEEEARRAGTQHEEASERDGAARSAKRCKRGARDASLIMASSHARREMRVLAVRGGSRPARLRCDYNHAFI